MLNEKLIDISAVGKYVPEKILTNKDLEKWLIPMTNGSLRELE